NQSKFIGTDATGTRALGNSFRAMHIPANARDSRVEDNRIAFNGGNGITIPGVTDSLSSPVRILIQSNEIYANTGLGIDLGDSGITPTIRVIPTLARTSS